MPDNIQQDSWDGIERRAAQSIERGEDSTMNGFIVFASQSLRSLDAQMKAMHIDLVGIKAELHSTKGDVEALKKAFPKDDEGGRDYDGHHDYHGNLIEASRSWAEIRKEVAKKVFTSVTWALLVLLAYSVWEYFKSKVKE